MYTMYDAKRRKRGALLLPLRRATLMEPVSPLRYASGPGLRSPAATVGYPEKFELARRFAEEGALLTDSSLDKSDQLLLYALTQQALHGPCAEPRPSMWDTVAKAKWHAWCELGQLSRVEAMFKYVQAVEEFAPEWMEWPPLQLELGTLFAELGVGATSFANEEPPLSAALLAPAAEAAAAAPSAAADADACAYAQGSSSSSSGGQAPPSSEGAPEATADTVAAEEELLRSLDEQLARRSTAPPMDARSEAAHSEQVTGLSTRLKQLLDASPRKRDSPAIQRALHCLACLAALGGPGRRRRLDDPHGALALAVRAAEPASDEELELPTAVQHLGLMVLVNVSLAPEGARTLDRHHAKLLQGLCDRADDPRSRSLARTVLDNIAQHAGILYHLTRRSPPGKLQLATPSTMMCTFDRLERSCRSAPPPCMPGNRQLPTALTECQLELAAEEAAAQAAALEAAEAAVAAENAAAEAQANLPPSSPQPAAANGHSAPSTPMPPNGTAGRNSSGSKALAMSVDAATPHLDGTPAPTTPATAAGPAGGSSPQGCPPVFSTPADLPPAPPSAYLEHDDVVVALASLRDCAKELYALFRLQPVARSTAPWGKGRLGIVLSSMGYALQHAPAAHASELAAIAHEYEANPTQTLALTLHPSPSPSPSTSPSP